jgi:hypothetical protein
MFSAKKDGEPMKRLVLLLLIIALLVPAVPVHSQQDTCGNAPPSRLIGAHHASIVAGKVVPVYSSPNSDKVGELPPDIGPIYLVEGPQCMDNTWWWHIAAGGFYDNWIPESVNGEYVVEPYQFVPEPPVPMGIPMVAPVISNPTVPLPAMQTARNPQNIPFAPWDWNATIAGAWYQPPDPMALQLPDAYKGDLPVPPVNLDNVLFVQDANLNAGQLALLAQNGFVVVPGGVAQFDDVYRGSGWDHTEGKGDFITTDALLHSLYLTYQNALMFLEINEFYGRVTAFVAGGYQAAEAQLTEATGTPLETPARNAAVYYAVALMLLADGEPYYTVGYNRLPAFTADDLIPSEVLAQADPAILALAQPMVDTARAAEGRLQVPVLEDYEEDFSQYKPRGYYAGNPLLESYFRAMMWMGRITFRAKSNADTLTGILVMRALLNAPGAYTAWSGMADTLNFLVGPMDDYSPVEYLPLGERAFGTGLPLSTLSDPAKLADFLAGVARLPGPRINSIPLPLGIQADQVDELTRGFRLFGQRFTLDGYIMQQLIYPEVGTAQMSRALPMALDVAAALGSDIAYTLTDAAGATAYQNYTEHLSALRGEVNGISGDNWLENLYGGWLWALQPLLYRDPALVPPLMQTDAWKRKDIHSSLGSWTELKHATLLYAEQPMGGLGGGGYTPPVTSASYVEPNPLVFARIAIVAATLDNGLAARGYYDQPGYTGLASVDTSLSSLMILSARLAEIAREEVAGEPVSYDDLYWLQETFDHELWVIRYEVEVWIPDPPESVALVADVASNPNAMTALEEGIGLVDYIYVITNSPYGLQLTRGGVYSTYEFVQPIDQRLTDDEWRAMIAAGNVPPRPAWIDLYFSQ